MAKTEPLVGRLDIEPIRKVFQREANDFSKWLEAHVEALAERLGIELTVVQREKVVGDFNVDLLCEDGEGRPVIIENQLEKTDHDHLGKLLTYLVNLDAAAAIWVTPEPRQEHQKVIDWLNESTPASIAFYLVKVEATRIGNSPFAPLFTVVASPDKLEKEIGEKKKEWADQHYKQLEFWKGLLERSKQRTTLFSTITPGRYHYIRTGAGKSGVGFAYVIHRDGGQVELYIDHDSDTGKLNKAIFDNLYAQKDAIEREFRDALEWERLDHRRASRIVKRFTGGGLAAPDTWPTLQDQMIDAMIRFEKVFRQRVTKVEI